jgi:hypothetical protein
MISGFMLLIAIGTLLKIDLIPSFGCSFTGLFAVEFSGVGGEEFLITS